MSFPGLSFGLGLAVLGLMGIWRFVANFLRNEKPWGIGWRLKDAFFVGLLFVGIGFFFIAIFPQAAKGKNLPLAFLFQTIASVAAALAIFWIAKKSEGVKALGLRKVPFRSLGAAALCYLFFLPSYYLLSAAWSLLLDSMDLHPAPQEMLVELLKLEDSVFVLLLFGIVLSGPFFEELFFRAFLQASLVKPFGSWISVILASGVFAILHEPIAYGPIFVLGLFLGYLYQQSKNLWVVFTVHALHNGLTSGLWLLLPEIRRNLGG